MTEHSGKSNLNSYRYLLAPTYRQKQALVRTLGICQEIFQGALESIRGALSPAEVNRRLTARRKAEPRLQSVYSAVLRYEIRKAEDYVWRERHKRRFKRIADSFKYPTFQGFKLYGSRIWASKIGMIRLAPWRPKEPEDFRPLLPRRVLAGVKGFRAKSLQFVRVSPAPKANWQNDVWEARVAAEHKVRHTYADWDGRCGHGCLLNIRPGDLVEYHEEHGWCHADADCCCPYCGEPSPACGCQPCPDGCGVPSEICGCQICPECGPGNCRCHKDLCSDEDGDDCEDETAA